MGIFLTFFSAYDTLAGIGTGLAMRSARGLPASQQDAVFGIVETWPALEPWVLWLSLLGTFGWVLALGYLAMTARSRGRTPVAVGLPRAGSRLSCWDIPHRSARSRSAACSSPPSCTSRRWRATTGSRVPHHASRDLTKQRLCKPRGADR